MKKPKPDPDLDELTAELRADTKRKRHEWQMLASYLAGEPVKAIAERWGPHQRLARHRGAGGTARTPLAGRSRAPAARRGRAGAHCGR